MINSMKNERKRGREGKNGMIPGILLCCMAALLPAVMLYFPNMEEIPLTGMLPYFGIMAGIGVLAWAGMYLVFRRKGLAAVAAAVWLLVLLNVGRLVPVIRERWPLAGIRIFAPATCLMVRRFIRRGPPRVSPRSRRCPPRSCRPPGGQCGPPARLHPGHG